MTGRVLIAGADSQLGRALLAQLGDRAVAGIPAAVSGSFQNALTIEDPELLDPATLKQFVAIINCVSCTAGTRAELESANIAYPVALARKAGAAGVARFVQVSSFSVYQPVERIKQDSPLLPQSDYGRSKLAAERILANLNGVTQVTSVRLPFMFSADDPELVGFLVSAMTRMRVFPVPYEGSSRRSMITYAGAADVLAKIATGSPAPAGVIAAADPNPLDLTDLAKMVTRLLGTSVTTVPIPAAIVSMVRLFAPALTTRLFRSSILDPEANWLADCRQYPVAEEVAAYLQLLGSRRCR